MHEEGYEGIKDKPNSGGRPPKLNEDDLEQLKAELKKKDYWTTQEVKKELLKKFGVDFIVIPHSSAVEMKSM